MRLGCVALWAALTLKKYITVEQDNGNREPSRDSTCRGEPGKQAGERFVGLKQARTSDIAFAENPEAETPGKMRGSLFSAPWHPGTKAGDVAT